MVVFIVLLTTLSLLIPTPSAGSQADDAERKCHGVVSYELELNTFWSKDVFTKQYPQYRPHAQFSKIIGRSHNGRYVLWSENKLATEALREFTEKALSTELDLESQGSRGVFDAFVGSPVSTGVGTSQVKFLIHPNYSKLSFVSRIIPSPDWFIGVDSLELCNGGEWTYEKTLDLDPMDSGSDRGFTFTSPNWPEEPQKPIHVITSKSPSHPASSFFYPELDHLPTIAQVKLRRIDLAWVDTNITVTPAAPAVRPRSIDVFDEGRLSKPTVKSEIEADKRAKSSREMQASISKTVRNMFPRSSEGKRQLRIGRTSQRKVVAPAPAEPGTGNGQVDCQVSTWSEWGACSKTCGFGTRSRTRSIVTRARNGGVPCPLLQEDQLCGSMRTCGWQHFSRQDSN